MFVEGDLRVFEQCLAGLARWGATATRLSVITGFAQNGITNGHDMELSKEYSRKMYISLYSANLAGGSECSY